jgi:hypothetical protein
MKFQKQAFNKLAEDKEVTDKLNNLMERFKQADVNVESIKKEKEHSI